MTLPAGACDAHCHIFGPAAEFPFAPERNYTPVDAPKQKLFALHRLLGIERAREQCALLVDQAIEHLRGFGEEADLLRQIARYVFERDR